MTYTCGGGGGNTVMCYWVARYTQLSLCIKIFVVHYTLTDNNYIISYLFVKPLKKVTNGIISCIYLSQSKLILESFWPTIIINLL